MNLTLSSLQARPPPSPAQPASQPSTTIRQEGLEVDGRVKNVTKYGVFVILEPSDEQLTGLIHKNDVLERVSLRKLNFSWVSTNRILRNSSLLIEN